MLKLELLNVSTTKDYNMESNVCSEVNGKNDHTNIERKSDVSSGTRDVVADLTVNEPMNDQDLQHSTPVSKERWTKEEITDAIVPNELKEMSKDDISNVDGLSVSEIVSKAVDRNGPDISLQPGEKQINSSGISSLHQGRALPSLKSLFESDQQPCQSPVEKVLERPVKGEIAMEENTPSNLKPHDILTVDELSKEPHDVLTVNHGGEADSSFSVAGLVSGVVTYSGHIGNISLRSDSSTTSSRSFAFPILQNEWNSSPVRMAKADRRHLQKHHGWRHGLLCCRF